MNTTKSINPLLLFIGLAFTTLIIIYLIPKMFNRDVPEQNQTTHSSEHASAESTTITIPDSYVTPKKLAYSSHPDYRVMFQGISDDDMIIDAAEKGVTNKKEWTTDINRAIADSKYGIGGRQTGGYVLVAYVQYKNSKKIISKSTGSGAINIVLNAVVYGAVPIRINNITTNADALIKIKSIIP